MLIGNFGQSQTTVPIQPAGRLTSPAYTFGPVIPVGRLAQASNAPVGPSSNSSTNQACQYRPSSNRSAYKTPPIRPSRTPQSQTDLSDLHALAQGTKNFPTNRIKQVAGYFYFTLKNYNRLAQIGWMGMGSGSDHDFNLGQVRSLRLFVDLILSKDCLPLYITENSHGSKRICFGLCTLVYHLQAKLDI
ncbi:uncharacterized protein LOC116122716 isoform X1 [Pistacia vera]|uniref:uncharacterized protein LOC116122716 isoform X1 n=1 Tax=Pistacia vera TaxID=55513 RepID=UPI001262DC64|nr:uncharacterized protein LOC116122716 isoform X1 [Pistacia vera]